MINSAQMKRQTECRSLYLVRFGFVNMAAVQLHGLKLSLGQIQEDQKTECKHSLLTHINLFFYTGEAYLDSKGLMVLDYHPGWHSRTHTHTLVLSLQRIPYLSKQSVIHIPIHNLFWCFAQCSGAFRCDFTPLAFTLRMAACCCLKAFHWVTD